MIVNIDTYMKDMQSLLTESFGEALCYIGLQGSYLRGEATENSDIDVVVILEKLTMADMGTYRQIIEKLPKPHLSCGFICGREEMQNWNTLELCQLLYSTRDYYGCLSDFLPCWTGDDAVQYVKLSADNLYHVLCHSYIHGSSEDLTDSLPGLYKQAYFILQNLHYLRSCRGDSAGEFVLSKRDLLDRLTGDERTILEKSLYYADGGSVVLEKDYRLLFAWCQGIVSKMAS